MHISIIEIETVVIKNRETLIVYDMKNEKLHKNGHHKLIFFSFATEKETAKRKNLR